MLLGFAENEKQAQALAKALAMPYAGITVHRFPDSESKLTLPLNLPAHVVICRSLDRPNDKLIELLLAAKTAHELGASRLTLVAPYLCYMRQDMAFKPGEAISQKIIGNFIADLFDDVITVDPHLHRTHDMAEAIPAVHSIAVSAGPAISKFLCSQNKPVLIGPDSESQQWVQDIAERSDLEYGVGNKTRLGDCEVKISLPEISLQARNVVLIDDVVSSGETMATTAQLCLASGASRVDIMVTHPLFAAGAEERLHHVGVKNIWSSDSIPHPSNAISLATLIANEIKALN